MGCLVRESALLDGEVWNRGDVAGKVSCSPVLRIPPTQFAHEATNIKHGYICRLDGGGQSLA